MFHAEKHAPLHTRPQMIPPSKVCSSDNWGLNSNYTIIVLGRSF